MSLYSTRDVLAFVLASESSNVETQAALVLVLMYRYRGRPELRLGVGLHQGGAQHFSTARAPRARHYAVVDKMLPEARRGLNYYGAKACYEWFAQARAHLRDPQRNKTPENIHLSWTSRGEALVHVKHGWLYYR